MHPTVSSTAQRPATVWLRDDRHRLLLAAMIWVLVVLMIVPEGFDYGILNTTGAPASGGLVSRALWLSLLGLSAFILLWRGGLAWLLARTVNPFLLLFVALAFASIAWSIDPALTLRRLVRMGTIVLACSAFVVMGWHARRYQNVVRPILTLVLVGSIAFGLAFPSLAIHRETAPELVGAWRGLANHKNGLGALSCIALIFWLHGWLVGEVRLASALTAGALAATCLVLSRSATSLAAAVFVMLFLVLALRAPRILRPYLPYLVGLLLVTLLLYALAVLNLIPGLSLLMAPISALTDMDLTFTGRTQIWSILADHISFHPVLGTGYGAYWTAGPVPGTESYAFIWRMGSFYPGSAHSGYLDVLNDLGWVGLLCLLGYIAVLAWHSLRLLVIDRRQAILYLALFFQQAITNLSETHWFSVLSVDFVLITLATTALARGLLEYRLRLAFGQPHASSVTPLHDAATPLRAAGSGAP